MFQSPLFSYNNQFSSNYREKIISSLFFKYSTTNCYPKRVYIVIRPMTPYKHYTSITTTHAKIKIYFGIPYVGKHNNFQVINKNYYQKKKNSLPSFGMYVHIISSNNHIETFATLQINKHKPF